MAEAGWNNYGVPRKVPNNAQEYTLTNEQFNFIANLVTTTNDIFSFQIPYPFYIDQREEAIIVHQIDFILRIWNVGGRAPAQQKLAVDIQYSDKEPAANWDGIGEDVEDENTQAMFDGPFQFGALTALAVDTDAPVPIPINTVKYENIHYYSPDKDGLDAFYPITVVFTNMSATYAITTTVAVAATFTLFEAVSLRIWFTTRKLTADEKRLMTSEYYGLVPLA